MVQISGALSPQEAFVSRVFGFILDVALIGLTYAALSSLGVSSNAAIAAIIVIAIIYLGLIQGLTGYTLGKICTGVVVVRSQTTRPAPFYVHLVRTLVLFLESGILAFGLLMLWGETGWAIVVLLIFAIGDQSITSSHSRRKRFGDRWMNTEVIGLPVSNSARILAGAVSSAIALALFLTVSVPLTLALLAIFGSMCVAFAWAAVAFSKRWISWPWICGAVLSFIPAVMMSSIDLCNETGTICPSDATIARYHLAAITIGVLIICAIPIMIKRTKFTSGLLLAGIAFSEMWMFLRLRNETDLGFAALTIFLLLLCGVVYEGVRRGRQILDHGKGFTTSSS